MLIRAHQNTIVVPSNPIFFSNDSISDTLENPSKFGTIAGFVAEI